MFENKKILVLGMARSGYEAAKYLIKHGNTVILNDGGSEEKQKKEQVEELKELNYINDENYIQRAVNEFKNLKNMSIKEIQYKLMTKGLKKDIIDNYICNNKEELLEYEIQSAKNIAIKKQNSLEREEIIAYLAKKGYLSETIKIALEE